MKIRSKDRKTYFITGTGTGIGKTIVSAILVRKLNADYWKPIQTGNEGESDKETVAKLTKGVNVNFHPETFKIPLPLSPYQAAKQMNIKLNAKDIKLPETNNSLIIEGVGGIMVPIEQNFLMIDLAAKWKIPLIVVSQNYLGSINHTLLTVEALKNRNIPIEGIVFNGTEIADSQGYILDKTGCRMIGHIKEEKEFSDEVVMKYAEDLRIC